MVMDETRFVTTSHNQTLQGNFTFIIAPGLIRNDEDMVFLPLA